MPILLFALWLLFNGRITLDVIISGCLVALFVTWFLSKFASWKLENDIYYLKKMPGVIGFLLQLVLEVVKANVHVITLVLSPRIEVQPKLVYYRTKVRTSIGKVALANSITLTPGTVTVDVEDDVVCVHALDDYSAEGLKDLWAEKRLERMARSLR